MNFRDLVRAPPGRGLSPVPLWTALKLNKTPPVRRIDLRKRPRKRVAVKALPYQLHLAVSTRRHSQIGAF